MLIIGLTGGIGAGKSFVADCFREAGVPVFDADATVHALLTPGGAGIVPVSEQFPEALEAGTINRRKLGERVFFDEAALKKLESILHPLVKKAGEQFLAEAMAATRSAIVQDIPLLFETGAEKDCHAVIVVSTPEQIRESRVLKRENMSGEKFEAIKALQMKDADKLARADFVIDGTAAKEEIKQEVRIILEKLEKKDA